jgi:hypothetical protein
MNEILKLVSNYLDGRPTFPVVRRILNILFNISISAYFLELYHGHYDWFNFTDYKRILDFFIRGNYIVPLIIFVLVHFSISFISKLFFEFFCFFYTNKLHSKILNFEYKPKEISQSISKVQDVSKLVVPVELTPKIMERVYQEIKKIKPEILHDIENKIKDQKRVIESNFYLVFRTIVALIVLKITLADFGNGLFVLSIIFLLASLFFLKLAYWFLDISPTIARKFLSIADSYFEIKLLNEDIESDN